MKENRFLKKVAGEINVETLTKMSGALAGYSVINPGTGGPVEEVWFDKPIKNRIVNSGLHRYAHPAAFVTSYSSDTLRWRGSNQSLLQWCAAGSMDTPTTDIMEGLPNGSTGLGTTTNPNEIVYVSIAHTQQGLQFCGTRFDIANREITLRITHRHTPARNDATIREIGYFFNSDNQTTVTAMRLFSRIVLDNPISVPTTHILQTTYDLTLHIPYMDITPIEIDMIGHEKLTGMARAVFSMPNSNNFVNDFTEAISTINMDGGNNNSRSAQSNTWGDVAFMTGNMSLVGTNLTSIDGGRFELNPIAPTTIDTFPNFGVDTWLADSYGWVFNRGASRINSFTVARTQLRLDHTTTALGRAGWIRILGLNWPENIPELVVRRMNLNGLQINLDPDKPLIKNAEQELIITYQNTAVAV
jgi:hypothetical protein